MTSCDLIVIICTHIQLEQLKQEMIRLEQLQADSSQEEGSHDDINIQNLKYQLNEVSVRDYIV